MGRPVLVLFDGVCNLCNASVYFIVKRDKLGLFKFAPLQWAAQQSHLAHLNLTPNTDPDSIVVIDGERMLTESDAALYIAKKLPLPWSLLSTFSLLPRGIRNALYRMVARNRYRWFGKKEACPMPRPEWKERFVHLQNG